jgi:hypothetical protein
MSQRHAEAIAQRPTKVERVCVVCGLSLIGRRPDARHCSPACRVEAHRIRAILSGSYSGPYRSVKERLEAGQKAYKDALVTNDEGFLTGGRPSAKETAIGKLVPDVGSGA